MLTRLELWEGLAGLTVVANLGMSEMPACHQDTARGCADRRTGVMLCESDAFLRESVDVRSRDLRLAVATDLAPSQIVREDENDVGLGVLGWGGHRVDRDNRSEEPDKRHDCTSNDVVHWLLTGFLFW